MPHSHTFDHIEEYLDGTLSDEKKKQFERDLSADPELAEEVKKHRQVRKLNELYARQQIMEKVKGIHERVRPERRAPEGFSFMKIAAAIAMLVVAGAVYFFVHSTYSSEGIAESAFEPYPNRFRTMGDEVRGTFLKAMELYDTRNFSEAVDLFKEIPEQDAHYIAAQLYLGISYLVLDQPALAIGALQKAEGGDELYKDVISWYLGLAYIENREEEKAREILRPLVEEGDFHAKEAEALLKKMDSPLRKLPGID